MKPATIGMFIVALAILFVAGFLAGTNYLSQVPNTVTRTNTISTNTTITATVSTTRTVSSTMTSIQPTTLTSTTTRLQPVIVSKTKLVTITESSGTTVTTALATKTVTSILTTSQTITETVTVIYTPEVVRGDLVLRGVSNGTNSLGWFYVRGEVYNNGTAVADSVRVIVTFYDSGRNVLYSVSTHTQPSTLDPEQAAPFAAAVADSDLSSKVTDFRIVVQLGE